MKIGDLVRDIEDSELGIVAELITRVNGVSDLIKVLRFCGRYDNMWIEEMEVIA